MFETEDLCEEVCGPITENIFNDILVWLSDDNPLLFPETRRESILDRYTAKNGPTHFEIKLAAISKESFQDLELESTLKKHYTKLEIEQKLNKDKPLEILPKRTKDEPNKISFTELMASAKKSYYEIEKEKMKPKEPEIIVKSKEIINVKTEFLQDTVLKKFRIEEEKIRNEKVKQAKRKCETASKPSKKLKTIQKDNNKVITLPSLVDEVVIRKLRIEKEKELMLKAKETSHNKVEGSIKGQNKTDTEKLVKGMNNNKAKRAAKVKK